MGGRARGRWGGGGRLFAVTLNQHSTFMFMTAVSSGPTVTKACLDYLAGGGGGVKGKTEARGKVLTKCLGLNKQNQSSLVLKDRFLTAKYKPLFVAPCSR